MIQEPQQAIQAEADPHQKSEVASRGGGGQTVSLLNRGSDVRCAYVSTPANSGMPPLQ